MHLLLIIGGLVAVVVLSIVAIAGIKRCHPPRSKPRIWKAAAAVVLGLCAGAAGAADLPLKTDRTDTTATARWIDSITVAPVGVVRWNDLAGSPDYGAGVDLGVRVNKFVSIHVQNLAYETCDWGGSAIDETALLVQADITRFSNESFTPYFLGGGVRDWDREDWGFQAGLGARINFNKRVSLGADYSLRAFFNHEKDGQLRGYLQASF